MPQRNKVALVTGGSRGIGAAIARRLAEDGADIAITYLSSEAAADGVIREIRALGRRATAIALDSAAPTAAVTAVDAVFEEFGRLDILVNSAGTFPNGPLPQVTGNEVDAALALHVRAPFLFSQAAARVMGPGGRIITVGSSFANRTPYPGVTLYSMTKAAVEGMTRGLARDLGDRGITVTAVHPGNIDTDMNPASAPEAAEELPAIPLGRYGEPRDIAAAVSYLAGDSGRYVTGTALTVDGGYNA
ncbi:SDR family NAD(P)-dependent oxidoreductase [Actinoalloteichus caeruleus]|uniref:NAD(P)-dependent dehydrogenase, short-chain alcohol dehydrogenase family n=2 Tax=Actinoalloteichus cyanogriseus TaxID=2893586 RepID=A0ABT1JEA5_ACTCY|nr:SDR family oxidoreductase [Actinoalloteichus caeruleus]MCP2330830.1 NAD(P)-dependent dehydrogenase, short-chain alcohol dehydrogenase family [Actinoalloteichus caeruleus DSM 43889]